MKKAISTRIKTTRTGKVLRRAMGLGHFRSRKNSTQLNRRKGMRVLGTAAKVLKQHN